MRRPLIPALLAVVLAGCSATATEPPGAAPPRSASVTFVLPPEVRPPDGPDGRRIVAAVGPRFQLFATPGAPRSTAYATRNDFGQDLRLPVVETTRRQNHVWFRVLVPERPNGRDAWVRERDVEVSRVDDRVVVDLSAHSLVLLRDDRTIREVSVAVGAPGTPTAPGRFFVWARVGYDDPTGPYGNYALGLSGFSEVLTEWPGGGRMAIHGTSDPEDIGTDVSHGCVRVFNPQMARLMDIPLGATVVIRP